MNASRIFSAFSAFLILGSIGYAQQAACTLPEPQYKVNKPNIFSEQQEQWLGEAQADQLESEYYLLPESDSAELTRIGQKLLAQLPPTAIHFTFRVYLSDEPNAFSVAGGYVYVSSKLITDARSEDELAGVLSHEIGHVYSHIGTITYTHQLKALMNVSSVTDKRDIADKVQLLINAPWKAKAEESGDDAERDELQADSIGLYAMARAGYSPPAFAQVLDRVSDNHGRSETFFRILAGEDTEMIARVRAARKLASQFSAACQSAPSSSSQSFLDFQNKLRTQAFRWQVPPTPGLESIALNPPMHPALDEVRFSPDGNLILAQEETAIHILQRSPLKLLFTIDAEGADEAHFSPDSSRVTVSYPSMRVETWNIATRQRESVHELVDYKGCTVDSFSPDGKTFTCITSGDSGIDLTFIDVDSEKIYYENKKWDEYPPLWEKVKILYTPDGRTMLIVAGYKAMAYDLDHRRPIPMGGALDSIGSGRIAFFGANKIAFDCGRPEQQKGGGYLYPMCMANFPTGELLGKFYLGDQWMEQISRGDGLLIGPVGDSPAILFEPETQKASLAFRMTSADVYGSSFASETPMGQVAVEDLNAPHAQMVNLAIRPLRPLAAGDFSDDGKYLAYSNSTRGVVWDLTQHSQVALLRPFTSMQFDGKDDLQIHLKKALGKPGTNLIYDPHTNKSIEGVKSEKFQALASGVLVTYVPHDANSDYIDGDAEIRISDPVTGALLWSRKYPHETPAIYGTDGDSLLLVMDLLSETGASEEGHNTNKLVKTSDVMKEWVQRGLLVEIVNARTGEIERVVHTPTRPSDDDERWADLYGDYLAVHGNVNNTVVYRVSNGVRTAAFYGRVLAGDGKRGLLAVNNRDQEVVVYDAASGNAVLRVIVDHRPRAARFIPSTNTLEVLTATQHVYSIPLPDVQKTVAAAQ